MVDIEWNQSREDSIWSQRCAHAAANAFVQKLKTKQRDLIQLSIQSAQLQNQTTTRETHAEREVDEENAMTASSASMSRIAVDADADYRLAEANAYSTVIAGLRYQERAFSILEANALLMAASSVASTSPWAAYDSMEASARYSWRTTVSQAREAKDSQVATVQRQLETAASDFDLSYVNRRIDYVEGLQRAVTAAPVTYNNDSPALPSVSLAPEIDAFYERIAQGTIPSSGDYLDGDDDGGYSYNPASAWNDNWDLIAQADAIQSSETTDIAIQLYDLSTTGLRSILDTAPSNQTGSDGSGYSGSGAGGEGEPPLESGEPLVFDFVTTQRISEILGESDPELQRLFEASATARHSSLPARPAATLLPSLSSPSPLTHLQDRSKTKSPTLVLLRNNSFLVEAQDTAMTAAQGFADSLDDQFGSSNSKFTELIFPIEEPETPLSEEEANAIIEFENMIATLTQKLSDLRELTPAQMLQFDAAGLTTGRQATWFSWFSWFSPEMKNVRIGQTNYAYSYQAGGHVPGSTPNSSGYTYPASWKLESVNNSSTNIDKAIFDQIRDKRHLTGLQTTEVLLSIVPGGSTATFIADGQYIRAGLTFASDVVHVVVPVSKIAKFQKLAAASSKVTRISNAALSAKTMATGILIVESLNAAVSAKGGIEDYQNGNNVGAAIGAIDVLLTTLHVGFNVEKFTEKAKIVRQVVEKSTPEFDAARLGRVVAQNSRAARLTGFVDPKERAIAEYLEDLGFTVTKNLREGAQGAGRQGDAYVNGVLHEFKTAGPGATSNTIRNQVNQSKKGTGQAREIIVDARNSGLVEEEARRGTYQALGSSRGKVDGITVIGDGYFFRSVPKAN